MSHPRNAPFNMYTIQYDHGDALVKLLNDQIKLTDIKN